MEKPFVTPKYRNITISGRAACGATTLSRYLSEKLGWTLINPGEIYRQYARDNHIPLEQTSQSSDSYHLNLDNMVKDKLKNGTNQIIEGWLSGFDAQEIPGVFKIFVNCSDLGVRIDRLVNRDKLTIEEAKTHLITREEENLAKWEKLYHTRDFWNPTLYNLVIDTYKNGPTETLNLVLQAIGY